MDGQNQQPVVHNHQQDSQPVTPLVPKTVKPGPVNKPKLNMSDQEAQALFAINNIEAGHIEHNKAGRPSLSLLITMAVLIIVVVLASIALTGLKKSGTNSGSSGSSTTGSSTQSESNGTDSVTNQINQDVNSCANPVDAVSEC